VGGLSGFKLRRDFDATTTTTTTPPRMHANSPPTLQPMPARKQEEDPQHTLSPWTYYKLICWTRVLLEQQILIQIPSHTHMTLIPTFHANQ
jgi:hypothetical protein